MGQYGPRIILANNRSCDVSVKNEAYVPASIDQHMCRYYYT